MALAFKINYIALKYLSYSTGCSKDIHGLANPNGWGKSLLTSLLPPVITKKGFIIKNLIGLAILMARTEKPTGGKPYRPAYNNVTGLLPTILAAAHMLSMLKPENKNDTNNHKESLYVLNCASVLYLVNIPISSTKTIVGVNSSNTNMANDTTPDISESIYKEDSKTSRAYPRKEKQPYNEKSYLIFISDNASKIITNNCQIDNKKTYYPSLLKPIQLFLDHLPKKTSKKKILEILKAREVNRLYIITSKTVLSQMFTKNTLELTPKGYKTNSIPIDNKLKALITERIS